MTRTNVIRFPARQGRGAFVHDDEERYYLQIELANDYAVMLSYPKVAADDPPAVTLHQGSGQSDFDKSYSALGLEFFRWFAEVATGAKSMDDLRCLARGTL